MSKNNKKNTLHRSLLATVSMIAVLSNSNLSALADPVRSMTIDTTTEGFKEEIKSDTGYEHILDPEIKEYIVNDSIGGDPDKTGNIHFNFQNILPSTRSTHLIRHSDITLPVLGRDAEHRINCVILKNRLNSIVTLQGVFADKFKLEHGSTIIKGNSSIEEVIIAGGPILLTLESFKGKIGNITAPPGTIVTLIIRNASLINGNLSNIPNLEINLKDQNNTLESITMNGLLSVIADSETVLKDFTFIGHGINTDRAAARQGFVPGNGTISWQNSRMHVNTMKTADEREYKGIISANSSLDLEVKDNEADLSLYTMESNSTLSVHNPTDVTFIPPKFLDATPTIDIKSRNNVIIKEYRNNPHHPEQLNTFHPLGTETQPIDTLKVQCENLTFEGDAFINTPDFNNAPTIVTLKKDKYKFGEMQNATNVSLKPAKDVIFCNSNLGVLKQYDFSKDHLLTLDNSTAKFTDPIIHEKGEGRLKLIGETAGFLSQLGTEEKPFGSIEIGKDTIGTVGEHYLGPLTLKHGAIFITTGAGKVNELINEKDTTIIFNNPNPITYTINQADLNHKIDISIGQEGVEFVGTLPVETLNLYTNAHVTLPDGKPLDGINIIVKKDNIRPQVTVSGTIHIINANQYIQDIDLLFKDAKIIHVHSTHFNAGIMPHTDNTLGVNIGNSAQPNAHDAWMRVQGLGASGKKLKEVNIINTTINQGDTYANINVGSYTRKKVRYSAGGTVRGTMTIFPQSEIKFMDGVKFGGNIISADNSYQLEAGKVTFAGSSNITGKIGSQEQLFEGDIKFTGDSQKQRLSSSIYTQKTINFGNNKIVLDAIPNDPVVLDGTTSINNNIDLKSNQLVLQNSYNSNTDDAVEYAIRTLFDAVVDEAIPDGATSSSWGPNTSITTTLSPDRVLGSIVVKSKLDIHGTVPVTVRDQVNEIPLTPEKYQFIDAQEGDVNLDPVVLENVQAYATWDIKQEGKRLYLIRYNDAKRVSAQDIKDAGGDDEDIANARNFADIVSASSTGDNSQAKSNDLAVDPQAVDPVAVDQQALVSPIRANQAATSPTIAPANNVPAANVNMTNQLAALTDCGKLDKKTRQEETLKSNSGNSEVVAKLNYDNMRHIQGMIRNRLSATGLDNIAPLSSGDEDSLPPKTQIGVWATPFYSHAHQKQKEVKTPAHVIKTVGGIVGVDVAPNDNLVLGAAISVLNADIKYKNLKAGSTINANTVMFSIYGMQKLTNQFFVEGIASYGVTKIASKDRRKCTFGEQIAKANYESIAYGGEILIGYNAVFNKSVLLTPVAGVRYIKSQDDAYQETGTKFLNRTVAASQNSRTDGIIGAKISGKLNVGSMVLVPEAHAMLSHHLGGKAGKFIVHLERDRQITTTNKTVKTLYNLGVSITAKNSTLEYGIGYDVHLAPKYIAHQGSLKVRINF